MNCEARQEQLALDLGGNLPAAEAADLQRHVEECPTCRRFDAELQESREALRRAVGPAPGEDRLARVRAGVLARLDGEVVRLDEARRRRRPAVRRWALAASLITAASWALFLAWRLISDPAAPKETRGTPTAEMNARVTPPIAPPTAPSSPTRDSTALLDAAPPPEDTAPSPAVKPSPAMKPSPLPPSAVAETRPASATVWLDGPARRPRPRQRSSVIEISALPAPTAASVTLISAMTPVPLEGTVILDDPPPFAKPELERISDRSRYTLYWLESPADSLEENEDADTQIM